MKYLLTTLLFVYTICLYGQSGMERERFSIRTAGSELTLMVGQDGYLYQLGYCEPGREFTIPVRGLSREKEFYPATGNGYITEGALEANHTDGNTSTDLWYVSHTVQKIYDNTELTAIKLKDPVYPFHVELYVKSYWQEDVLEM